MEKPNERRQWRENGKFFRQEELTFRDCDPLGRVRPASLMCMMALAGSYDYDAWGLNYEVLYRMHQVFLFSRASFRLHGYAQAGETITLTTWENGVHGAHMQRNYEFFRQDGSLFLSGQGEWILVDPEDRRILRPADFTAKPLTNLGVGVDCPACRRVLPPRDRLEQLGQRPVRFSDLDHNGHLFSGNYPDIVWDYLPTELQTAVLRDFQINYSKEAVMGDTLDISGCRDGKTYEVEAVCAGQRCFTCRCEFE